MNVFFVACLNKEDRKTPQARFKYPADVDTSAFLPFCFPDAETTLKLRQPEELDSSSSASVQALQVSDKYTFIITETGGTRVYGYVLRYLPVMTESRFVEVLCMMSPFPAFERFYGILEQLHVRWVVEPKAVFTMVQQIKAELSQADGAFASLNIKIQTGIAKSNASVDPAADSPKVFEFYKKVTHPIPLELSFPRLCRKHALEQLHHVTCRDSGSSRLPLFEHIPLDAVQVLFSAMLNEEKIVCISSDLSVLSDTLHALVALLFPFPWPHLFIPVLPPSLIRFAAAPFPFILGIQPEMVEDMLALPSLEKLFVFNIDDNVLSILEDDSAQDDDDDQKNELLGNALPKMLYGRLRKALNSLGCQKLFKRKRKKDQVPSLNEPLKRIQLDLDVSMVFLTFFVQLFAFCDWTALPTPAKIVRPATETPKKRCYCCEVDVDQRVGKVDFDKFVAPAQDHNEECFDFLVGFVHTQMIEQFFTAELSFRTPEAFPFLLTVLRCEQMLNKESFSKVFVALNQVRAKLRKDDVASLAADQKQIVSGLMELTSNTDAFVEDVLLARVTDASFIARNIPLYNPVFLHRLRDCKGRQWKHAYKTLNVIDHLVKYGSDRMLSLFVQDCTSPNSVFSYLQRLTNYRHSNSSVTAQINTLSFKLISIFAKLPAIRDLRVYAPLVDLSAFEEVEAKTSTDEPEVPRPSKVHRSSTNVLDLSALSECFPLDGDAVNTAGQEQWMSSTWPVEHKKRESRVLNPFDMAPPELLDDTTTDTNDPFKANVDPFGSFDNSREVTTMSVNDTDVSMNSTTDAWNLFPSPNTTVNNSMDINLSGNGETLQSNDLDIFFLPVSPNMSTDDQKHTQGPPSSVKSDNKVNRRISFGMDIFSEFKDPKAK